MAYVNNSPLKSGYIFIQTDQVAPCGYSAWHLGGLGYYSRLTEDSTNGHTPVTTEEYDKA